MLTCLLTVLLCASFLLVIHVGVHPITAYTALFADEDRTALCVTGQRRSRAARGHDNINDRGGSMTVP